MKNLAKVHKTNRLLMVIFCKEIYFVSYQQIETLDSDKIVNDDFPNQWKCTPTVLLSHLMRIE